MELLFLDTETTGFGACRLIELAYGPLEGPIEVLRCKNPIPIEEGASAVNGIYAKDLELYPLFTGYPQFGDIKARLEAATIVAHSALFDIEVLEREGIIIRSYIDTKKLARQLYPSLASHRLQDLRSSLGLYGSWEAHTASGDVSVLIELYRKIRADFEAEGVAPEDIHQHMRRQSMPS